MSLPLPGTPTAIADRHAPGQDDAQLHGRWLAAARIAWIFAALIILLLDVLGTPAAIHQLQTACVGGWRCQSPELTPDQFRKLFTSGITPSFYATYLVAWNWLNTLVFVIVATIIMVRRSADRMALFGAFMLLTFGAAAANGTMWALPSASSWWWLPVTLMSVVGQVMFYVFFCLFPGGHFVPRWIIWAAVLEAIDQVVAAVPLPALQGDQGTAITNLVFVALIAVLIGAQVYRYRRVSTYRERQQTKWVVVGLALGLGIFIALLTYGEVALGPGARDDPRGTLVINTIFSLLICMVPISIGVAILRSGLWDVDVIIRGTLVYGVLTAILAAVYFGSVVGMQQIASALAGPQARQNPLIIVVSTLLIAALFTPLRGRLQRFIDRRFYRAKYDTARTLERFTATLRSEVELSALNAHLVGVVEETMRPAHVSLWLRNPPEEAAQ